MAVINGDVFHLFSLRSYIIKFDNKTSREKKDEVYQPFSFFLERDLMNLYREIIERR